MSQWVFKSDACAESLGNSCLCFNYESRTDLDPSDLICCLDRKEPIKGGPLCHVKIKRTKILLVVGVTDVVYGSICVENFMSTLEILFSLNFLLLNCMYQNQRLCVLL